MQDRIHRILITLSPREKEMAENLARLEDLRMTQLFRKMLRERHATAFPSDQGKSK